jgi:AcrR family transcriptional regulator
MPRMKQDERQQIQSETRLSLIEAAIAAFANHGYAGAKVDVISREAGFAKGTIYNYFASKRELMLAVIEAISGDHNAFVAAAVLAGTDPVERLSSFYEGGFQWVGDHPAPAHVLITTLNGPDPEFKRAMHLAYEPMFHLVREQILAPGVALGEFRSVELASGMLMSLYLGTSSQVDAAGQPHIDPQLVADFALHALRP